MFWVGQKVVCIDNDDHPEWQTAEARTCKEQVSYWLERGNIYVIRKIVSRKNLTIWLRGINRRRTDRGDQEWRDTGFMAERFRPLVERKTDIAIFKKLVAPKRQRELADR